MKRSTKKFVVMFLSLVLVIGSTLMVNAASVTGEHLGYTGKGSVYTTSSSIRASMNSEPWGVSLSGNAYTSNGISIAYVYASSAGGSCNDSVSQLQNVSYGSCSFYMSSSVGANFIGSTKT